MRMPFSFGERQEIAGIVRPRQMYMKGSLTYMQWKGWRGEFCYDAWQAEYYAGEFRAYELKGMRILEIGFGDGGFLAWARDRGANVCGTELIRDLVEAGKKKGFDVVCGEVDQAHELAGREFDLIVAFDVFEHIELPRLRVYMKMYRSLLSESGEVLCRFPNGQSPWGRTYQYADATHVSVLSAPVMDQICRETGLTVIEARNPYRVKGSGLRCLLRAILYSLRDALHFCLRKIYMLEPTFLDPNVVVRMGLSKRVSQEST